MEANKIKKAACLGAGVIGSSWATYFAMRGYPVCVCDNNSQQLDTAKKNITNNLEFLVRKEVLGKDKAVRAEEIVTFTTSVEEAVNYVQFIQESTPENYEIKQQVLAEIEKYTPADTIFSSSTSGLLITEIAKFAKHPERCVGGHPYNPPHLIPLVEVTKGEKSSPEAVKCAYDFYSLIDKEPVILRKETLGFIANRLQIALNREAVDLVVRGVCSVEDIDKAVLFGPGLRYAILGPNLIMHLGGGAQGIRGLLKHLHDSAELWLKDMANWTKEPEEWPDLAHEGVIREIENRPAEFGKTTEEIIEFRDNMLIELLKLHKKL